MDQLRGQWVGVGFHMLTGSNVEKMNVLDFLDSGTPSEIHGMWSFVICLRRDFAPAGRPPFSPRESLVTLPAPSTSSYHFFPSVVYSRAYCVQNAVLDSRDAACTSQSAGSTFLSPLLPSTCQQYLHDSSEAIKNLVSLWKTALKRNPGGVLKKF